MSEPTPTNSRAATAPIADERRRPSLRNRTIYERRVLGGETLAALATEYNVTHQRIAQITTRVEGWIAGHPEDQLANRLRLRCRLRYEALYESAVTGFADSRKQEVTVKQRKTTRALKNGSPNVEFRSMEPRPSAEKNAAEERPSAEDSAIEQRHSAENGAERRPSAERKATMFDDDQQEAKPMVVITVEERIVRQRHGDPRLLATAMKAVEKLERFAAALARDDERASPRRPAKNKDHSFWVKAEAGEKAGVGGRDSGEKAGVGGQDSGVRAENSTFESFSLPSADCAPPSSAATHHAPLTPPSLDTADCALPIAPATASPPTAGCLLPTSPATPPLPTPPTRPKRVLIVGHFDQIDRMTAMAQTRLPGFEVTPTCYASIAKEWIDKHVHEAALIWLESDLGRKRELPGGTGFA